MGTAQKRRSPGSKTTKYEHGERPDNGRVGCPTISKRIFSSTPLMDGACAQIKAQRSALRSQISQAYLFVIATMVAAS